MDGMATKQQGNEKDYINCSNPPFIYPFIEC